MIPVQTHCFKLLPLISLVLLSEGCMPRQADGSYPKSVYSYHPYNKQTPFTETPSYPQNDLTCYTQRPVPSKVTYPKNTYHTSYNPFNHLQKKKPLYMDSYTNTPVYQEPSTPKQSYSSNFIERIERLAKLQMGKRYQWAGNGPYAFDCSGFTKYVFEHNGVSLPRNSRQQATVGQYVTMANLRKGDLVFFRKKHSAMINHTGIFLGEGEFIHASSSQKGVVISPLDHGYYHEHFELGRRVTPSL